MAVPLDQFVKSLTDSGILSAETLKDFLPPTASPKDAEELARELLRKKKLTKFQAEEVYKGKGKALTLGNYILMEKIGAGGMGQVFKARHRRMDRIVAVKLLPPTMTKDPAAIARFEREVKAAARLRHPNIVAADDADCANGVHFLVMEYVEGNDLSALVKKDGPFSVDKAVRFILQAARGLEAAHAEGIVHRDIKPANLLLDKKGTVKILDMGLARLSTEGDVSAAAELTSAGAVMGTVDYMAPEQALDTRTADARADIYSLGCTLFHLVTGKSTYSGTSLMAILVAHREKPVPSLRAYCPDASESIDAVFQKMIAKSVTDRYQSAKQLITDLEQCTTSSGNPSSAQISLAPTGPATAEMSMPDFLREISMVSNSPVATKKGPTFDLAKEWKKIALVGGGLLAFLILIISLGVILNRPKDGALVLTINESGAEIQILDADGKEEVSKKSEKGNMTFPVRPGKHSLKVSKDGFEVFFKDLDILPGTQQSLTAKLNPATKIKTAQKPINQPENPPAIPPAPTAPTPPIRKTDLTFFDLFNGRDLTGWTPMGSPTNWEVDGDAGVLKATGKAGVSWLLTEKDYGDLILRFEYQADAGANSGIALLAAPTDKDHLEIQIGQTGAFTTGGIWSNPANTTNGGYLAVQTPAPENPPGQWNTMEIELRSRKWKIQVNGVTVSQMDFEDLAKQADSFTAWKRSKGRIGLQSQTNQVRFRKIQVSELPDTSLVANVGIPHPTGRFALEFSKYDTVETKEIPFPNSIINTTEAWVTVTGDAPGGFWRILQSPNGHLTAYLDNKTFAYYTFHGAASGPLGPIPTERIHLAGVNDGKGRRLYLNGKLIGKSDEPGLLDPDKTYRKISLGGELVGTIQAARFSSVARYNGDFTPPRIFKSDSDTMALYLFNEGKGDQLIDHSGKGNHAKITGAKWVDAPPLPLNTLSDPEFQRWMKTVGPLPPMEQSQAIATKLQELNPGFDGKVTPTIEGNMLTGLEFYTDHITDLSPVRAAPNLTKLRAFGTNPGAGILEDLSTLKGMKLIHVNIQSNRVSDLSPLTGMKLESLLCSFNSIVNLNPIKGMALKILSIRDFKISDISLVKGMPLEFLDLYGSEVTDLKPITGMKLKTLVMGATKISDLKPVTGMPLDHLEANGTLISSLAPLKGSPITQLEILGSTKLKDLSPIKDLPLKVLRCDFDPKRHSELLRSIKTLELINEKKVEDFWKDQGK